MIYAPAIDLKSRLKHDLRSGGAERVLCKWSDLLSGENNITIYTFDGQADPEYSYSGKLSVLDLPSRGKNKVKQMLTLVKRYLRLRKQGIEYTCQ